MQRRHFPLRRPDSILLYGFGLALALSLVFNGVLLYEQSRQRSLYDCESGNPVHTLDNVVWQRQLSDCKQANQQKDSRFGGPTLRRSDASAVRRFGGPADSPTGAGTQRTAGSGGHCSAHRIELVYATAVRFHNHKTPY